MRSFTFNVTSFLIEVEVNPQRGMMQGDVVVYIQNYIDELTFNGAISSYLSFADGFLLPYLYLLLPRASISGKFPPF